MTHYATLGVEPTATDLEILDAYSELSDWLSSAEGVDAVMYGLVQEAFDVLSIPEKRAEYDASLMALLAVEEATPDVDPDLDSSPPAGRISVSGLVHSIGWFGIAGLTFAAAIAGYGTFQITGSGDGASVVFFIGTAVLVFLMLRIYWRVTNNR